jgi:hypothetical protein
MRAPLASSADFFAHEDQEVVRVVNTPINTGLDIH